jgi:hypothetical protein
MAKTGDSESNILYPTYSDDLYTAAPEQVGGRHRRRVAWSPAQRLRLAVTLVVVVVAALWFGFRAATTEVVSHYAVAAAAGAPNNADLRRLLVPDIQEELIPSEVLDEFHHQLLLEIELRKEQMAGLEGGPAGQMALHAGGGKSSFADAVEITYNYVSEIEQRRIVGAAESIALTLISVETEHPGAANEWLSDLVSKTERRTADFMAARTETRVDQEIKRLENEIVNKKELARLNRYSELESMRKALATAKRFGILLPVRTPHPLAVGDDTEYLRGTRDLDREVQRMEAQLDADVQGIEGLRSQIAKLRGVSISADAVVAANIGRPIEIKEVYGGKPSLTGNLVLGALFGLLASWLLLKLIALTPLGTRLKTA